MDEKKIIENCRDFISRSNARFADVIASQEKALRALGGNIWDDALKKTWKIGNRPIIHNDLFAKIINGIASPYSASPYHVSLADQNAKDLQDALNRIEHDSDAKSQYQQAFKRAAAVGAGYVVVGVNDDGLPELEFAVQQSSVAIDPDAKKPDLRDATEGATVRYIGIDKARALYGDNVVPSNYPNKCDGLDLGSFRYWGNKKDYIQIVNYYALESGNVTLYKICGRKVIAPPIVLPIDRIPIVRFAGYSTYDEAEGVNYCGVVQRLWDAQVAYDLVWTKTLTRMQQTLKARAVMGISAADGVKEYLRKMESNDLLALLYNDRPDKMGNKPAPPTIVSESFNAADLSQVLNNIRTSIPDVSGIPLEGSQNIQRTATEILTQQENNESNVQELYVNAEAANRTIGRMLVMMLNGGARADFMLENGPAVITSNMKRRQEINAIASFYPDDKKMLLAIKMAETIDSSMAADVAEMTKANLPNGLTLPNDNSSGAALYALKQTQMQFDAAMQQATELKTENDELKAQIRELQQAASDMKRQQEMEWAKFRVDTNLKIAQTNFENGVEVKKLEAEQDKIILDAQKAAAENQRKSAEALLKAGK